MDQIRPWLYIGNYNDTQNKNLLDFHSVKSVLQLAAPVKLPGIHLLHIPVRDLSPISAEHLRQGMDFALAEKEKGNKILIACAAGVNRSSAFCIAALKETEEMPLIEAFKEVRKNHQIAMPQEFAWESLCCYYKEDVPYIKVMRVSAQHY